MEQISQLFETESAAHEAHLREQQRSLSHDARQHGAAHQGPSCCGRYQTTEAAGAEAGAGADCCRSSSSSAKGGAGVGLGGDETV